MHHTLPHREQHICARCDDGWWRCMYVTLRVDLLWCARVLTNGYVLDRRACHMHRQCMHSTATYSSVSVRVYVCWCVPSGCAYTSRNPRARSYQNQSTGWRKPGSMLPWSEAWHSVAATCSIIHSSWMHCVCSWRSMWWWYRQCVRVCVANREFNRAAERDVIPTT